MAAGADEGETDPDPGSCDPVRRRRITKLYAIEAWDEDLRSRGLVDRDGWPAGRHEEAAPLVCLSARVARASIRVIWGGPADPRAKPKVVVFHKARVR